MTQLVRAESYQRILVDKVPLLDVRAPIEFQKGAMPGATNLPLLDDSERDAVGKVYQQQGQDAAVALGNKLVSAELREQRVQRWIDFLQQHPDALIYCFRGGLRSRTTQQWMAQAGLKVPRVAGGYKAMRRFLLDTIVTASSACEFLIVAGKTGCGKTQLLGQFDNRIDLEGIANHRGSAFGTRIMPQPTQINFENALAVELLTLPYSKYQRLVVEDESRAIGALAVPLEFHAAMSKAPIAVIEEEMPERVNTILNAYIASNYSEFISQDPCGGEVCFADYLFSSLSRIKKRLGENLFREINQDMKLALAAHDRDHSIAHHKVWIEKLLHKYYDPMYDYQLSKKFNRIIFRGDRNEFMHWASRLKHHKEKN